VKVLDVASARDLGGVLEHASISLHPWTHNSKGFFYAREDTASHRQRIYFHGPNNPQAKDGIVYSRLDEPDWTYSVRVSDDGQFAVITIFHPQDDHTRIYFIDLDNPDKPTLDAPVVKLIDNFGSRFTFVDNGGSFFFLQTDRGARNGRIILANTNVIRESRWQTVVPESADTLLFARTAGEQYLITVSQNDGKTFTRVYAPPSSKELEEEYRQHADSVRRAMGDHAPPPRGRGRGDMSRGMHPYNMPTFRMNLIREIAMPANATLLDMTSNANDDELFYTVKMSDGTTRSYLYNVSNRDNEIFNTTAVASK
jgi:protease II